MAIASGRADARRNRERLLQVAAEAFGADDAPTLESIARSAGVGIGTLYRHFPTREDLVEAVYRAELDRVCAGAAELLADHPPPTALRLWMSRYADFVATKRGMAEALRAVIASGAVTSRGTREQLDTAIATLLDAGARAGTLRGDVRPSDVSASLAGLLLATSGHLGSPGPATAEDEAERRAQLDRMLDLLHAGLLVNLGPAS